MSIKYTHRWLALLLLPLLLMACVAGPSANDAVRQALAPTGTLRIGVYPGSPTSMVKDAKTGEVRGVSVEVGKELARRLHVPYELVEYPLIADVINGMRVKAVDFTISNSTPERAKEIDFTQPVLAVESGYLVPAGSAIATFADIDQPGVRVGVSQGSTSFTILSRDLKHASLVQAPNVQSAIDMLMQHKVDAYATNKGILYQMSDSLPGSRVLEGRWNLEYMSMAVPKGRDQGVDYLHKLVDDPDIQKLVAQAAQRAGLRGTVSVKTISVETR